MIIYSPVIGHLRGFKDPNAQYGDAYDSILTVQWWCDHDVFISGALGDITPRDYTDLTKLLRTMGVKTITWKHKGKLKVRNL